MKKSITTTVFDNLLTFRNTGREFELEGDLLEMITNKNYNVDLASLSDKKILYDFAKEMNFDVKCFGRKSTRDRTLINLPKIPSLMFFSSGSLKTIFLSSNPDEFCNRLKVLLQQKQAGNNSDINYQEIVAIVDKSLEYKRISKKQNKHFLNKCNLINK